VLWALHSQSKLLECEFRPGGIHREWCDPDVPQQIRRKTLARLRREVTPAEQHVSSRLLVRWQGTTAPRRGVEALLDAVELLQGAELIASDLEREILPAGVADYHPSDLDALLATGDIVWMGRERLGNRDGRISLYLPGSAGHLLPPGFGEALPDEFSEHARRILSFLQAAGGLVSPDCPPGYGRRVSERDGGRGLGIGLGRPGDERHVVPLANAAGGAREGTAASYVRILAARIAWIPGACKSAARPGWRRAMVRDHAAV
jgi:ATP-dependent Lhr-like helicase